MSKMNQFLAETASALPVALGSTIFSLVFLSFSGILRQFSLSDIALAFLLTVFLISQVIRTFSNHVNVRM
ncbi:hypothetical protein MQE36_14245 [Zhouia spongiae]|uniref:Uncharacterized protein n=1 Tax=Zhouia spongiae TaxID=2202721 RepID=A0ABY3YKA3_9FLAO|nr:hypothetical protein [Zhouia spongiae]UNY98239.1 hypothetical protein MQE36_14245 [Zhouia spongiae]